MEMGCYEIGFGRQKDGGDQKKQRWVGIWKLVLIWSNVIVLYEKERNREKVADSGSVDGNR